MLNMDISSIGRNVVKDQMGEVQDQKVFPGPKIVAQNSSVWTKTNKCGPILKGVIQYSKLWYKNPSARSQSKICTNTIYATGALDKSGGSCNTFF